MKTTTPKKKHTGRQTGNRHEGPTGLTITLSSERPESPLNGVMTEEQFIALMRKTQGDKSLRDFSAEMKVSPAYLSDIYNLRRHPGPKVLKFFGIGKTRRVIVEYEFFKK